MVEWTDLDERMIPDAILDERSRAFAALLTRFRTLPVDAAHIMALDTVPAAVLPWLAVHFDIVPLFGLVQSDAEQRSMIRSALRLHRLRGTESGLRRVAALTGTTIPYLVTPPAKTFLGYWDAASRAAWLAQHPQLRIYARRARSTATGFMLGADYSDEHLVRTDALYRSTSRVTLRLADGAEVELTVREWRIETSEGNATLELARHDHAPGLHCGQPLDGYTARYTASERLWAIDQTQYSYSVPVMSIRTLTAGYAPLSTDVETVSERAIRLGFAGFGLPVTGFHPTRMDTETRLYRRVYLHDPDIAALNKPGPAYLGRTRLRQPHHVAEARLRLPMRRSQSALAGGAGPWYPADRQADAALSPTLDALNWMRRASDRIGINTHQRAVALATPTLKAGAILAGQFIERT